MSKEITLCPEPRLFLKWYRRKVQSNMAALHEQGKSLRTFGFGVTEDQVNRHYRFFKKDWQPGQVMTKLNECGIPCINRKTPQDPVNGLTIAVKPKDERSLQHNGQRSNSTTPGSDGGDLRPGT